MSKMKDFPQSVFSLTLSKSSFGGFHITENYWTRLRQELAVEWSSQLANSKTRKIIGKDESDFEVPRTVDVRLLYEGNSGQPTDG